LVELPKVSIWQIDHFGGTLLKHRGVADGHALVAQTRGLWKPPNGGSVAASAARYRSIRLT
jgi:hypothetical protein